MVKISQAIARLESCSLTFCIVALLVNAVAQGASPVGQSRYKTAAERSREAQSKAEADSLFQLLLQSNRDYWDEKAEQEISLLEARLDSEWELKRQDVEREKDERRQLAVAHFERALGARPDSYASVEARFRLALLLSREEQRPNARIVKLLDEGIRYLEFTNTFDKLYVQICLLRAEIAFQMRDERSVTKFLENVLKRKNALARKAPDEVIRAHIALADLHFTRYAYRRAHELYASAFEMIALSAEKTYFSNATLLPGLYVRLLWSAFRDGDSLASSHWALEFARQRHRFQKLPPEPVLKDIIRIGGISFYEKNNSEDFESLARDVLAGDFGKKMIAASFEFYCKAGRPAEVEPIALRIEKDFAFSLELRAFSQARLGCLSKVEQEARKYHEVVEKVVTSLARNGMWAKRFALTKEEEMMRARFVATHAEQSAHYFLQQAKITGLKADFLSSEVLFHIRLQEHAENESRGALLLGACEAAKNAGDLENAWNDCTKSLQYSLTERERRGIHFLLVEVGRAFSESVLSAKDPLQLRYESAVDAFIDTYPDDFSAHDALFESGKRLETLRELDAARMRYERLVSLLARYGKNSETLHDRVSVALASVNAQLENASQSLTASQGLERLGKILPLSADTDLLLQSANSAAVRSRASELRRAGRIVEAATLLSRWGRSFPENLEAPSILLSATRLWAENLMWKNVLEEADFYSQKYVLHESFAEILFWKARAQEGELHFTAALETFQKAAEYEPAKWDEKHYEDSLIRGIEIARNLEKSEVAAKLMEKLSLLKRDKKSDEMFGEESLHAAWEYLKNKKPKDALRNFERILANRRVSARLKEEARLGKILAHMTQSETLRKGKKELKGYLGGLAKQGKKNKWTAERTKVFEKGILFLSQDLREEFMSIVSNTPFENLNKNGVKRLEDLVQESERVATWGEGRVTRGAQAQVLRHAGSMSLELAELFRKSALPLTSGKSPKIVQSRAQFVFKYNTKAQKNLFRAFTLSDEMHLEKAAAGKELQRLVEVRRGVVVAPELAAEKDKKSFPLRESILAAVSQGETP
jgi:hypothetical protein